VSPDIFESDDVAKSCPVSYRTRNQHGGTTCRPSFYGACSKDILLQRSPGTKVNPDTIRCVWTGELDLNRLRVDGGDFQIREEKVGDSKISG